MEPIRKTAHGPPGGYVIDSRRYLTVSEAARFVGRELICKKTMWNYAKAGHDKSGGLDLAVIRHPLLRTGHQRARSSKQWRFLIPEDRLVVLRAVLQECKTNRGKESAEVLADMRDAAARHLHRLCNQPDAPTL